MILFKEYTNLEKFETFFTADTYNENKQKFLQFLLYLRLTRLLYNFINPLNLNDIEVYRTSFQSLEFPRIFNVLTLKNCNSNVIYMLFLYYRSLQIRMGGKKGKAWIDEDGFVSRNSGMQQGFIISHSYSDSFFLRKPNWPISFILSNCGLPSATRNP